MSVLVVDHSDHLTSMDLIRPWIISFVTLVAFTTPSFTGLLSRAGLPKYTGSQVIYMVVLIICVLSINYSRRAESTVTWAFSVSFFFMLLSLGAIWASITAHGIRDLVELSRPVYALILFLSFFGCAVSHGSLVPQRVCKIYWALIVGMAIYSTIEAVWSPVGAGLATYLYKDDRPILYARATGVFGITYKYAYFMIFGLWFSVSRFLTSRKGFYVVISLVVLLSILLSQSRTLFLALIVSIFLVPTLSWSVWSRSMRRHMLKVFLLVTLVVATLVVAYWNHLIVLFGYLYGGIRMLLVSGITVGGVGSANIRVSQIAWAWDNQFAVPLIGRGMGKDAPVMLESLYSLYLYRYGLLGVTMAFVMAAIGAVHARLAAARALSMGDMLIGSFFMGLFALYVISPIAWLSSAMHDFPRMAVLYYGGMGLAVAYTAVRRRCERGHAC